MRSVEIQAFIDKVWIERGIFVHIDPRMPDAILTREVDVTDSHTMPRAILAPDLDSAKALLAKTMSAKIA